MFRGFSKSCFVIAILWTTVPAAVKGAAVTDYLNVKAYTEFVSAPGSNKTFNYSGKGVFYSFPASGTARIVFEDLARWTYRPTVQITPRSNSGKSMPACGARLETEGYHLVAIVTCRPGSVVATKPEFTLLIVDETSDAAYTLVTSCTNCGKANIHNPWARNDLNPVRVQYLTGRTGVFFKMDAKPPVTEFAPPMAFVTPVSSAVSCEVFSIGSKAERADEYGVEIACTVARSTSPTAIPQPPVDMSFHLLLVPRSARTATIFAAENGDTWMSSSEAGLIEARRTSTGRYLVSFANLAYRWADDGIALVTSHGAGGKTCSLEGQYKSGDDVEIAVVCRNASGDLVDSRFLVMATSRH
ncbi:MAG: hypothetical protein H7039_06745 [Bryobacteraceae bacterium]|nr:hypothetical protein [Bryobacteraceae bacterium]